MGQNRNKNNTVSISKDTTPHILPVAQRHACKGPRFKCNAAVALSFLRTRFNHRPADRLGDVVRLACYSVRTLHCGL